MFFTLEKNVQNFTGIYIIVESKAFLHTQIPLLHEQGSLSFYHAIEECPHCCILLTPNSELLSDSHTSAYQA